MKTDYKSIIIVLLAFTILAGSMIVRRWATAQEAHIARLDIAAADRARADAAVLRLSPPMAEYAISSPTGVRQSPMGGGEVGLHKGCDLVGPEKAPVLAAAPGIVIDHYPPPGTPRPEGGTYGGHPVFGGYIVIDHGGGVYTLYGHLRQTKVHIGWYVECGQPIGVQGSTGISAGEHLHFEVIVDPEAAIRGRIPQAEPQEAP